LVTCTGCIYGETKKYIKRSKRDLFCDVTYCALPAMQRYGYKL